MPWWGSGGFRAALPAETLTHQTPHRGGGRLRPAFNKGLANGSMGLDGVGQAIDAVAVQAQGNYRKSSNCE